MSLPLDAGRAIRARVTAAVVHDARHHTHTPVETCEGSGWKLRASCCDPQGRAVCPLCRHRVTTTIAGGVAQIDPHLTPGGGR